MKVIITPQNFKGTDTGREVYGLVSDAILKKHSRWNVIQQPTGDGGDGTLELLIASNSARKAPLLRILSRLQNVLY